MEFEIYSMVYRIRKEEGSLRILGEKFVRKNKGKGLLIIRNKKHSLRELIPMPKDINGDFKIKICFLNTIYNKSYMFQGCDSLIKFSFYDKTKVNDNIILIEEEEEKEINYYKNDNFKSLERNYSTISNYYKYSFEYTSSYDEIKEKSSSALAYIYKNIDDKKYEYSIE